MKRTFFLPLVVAAALMAGCPGPDSNTGPGGGNAAKNASDGNRVSTQDVNVNANANATTTNDNQGIAPVTRPKEEKAVTLIVYTDNAGQRVIAIAPESIRLFQRKNEKLRFHVFNDLDVDLTEVNVNFKTTDPFDGSPFKITNIAAGNDKSSGARVIKPAAGTGDTKYAYGVTATAADNGPVQPHDPEIIINRDR